MRRVGDEVAVGVEDRAGKVQALLDVDGIRRVLQAQSHLLGDRHEQVVEDFQHHRIDRRADRVALGQCLHAAQHEVVVGRDLGAPAGLHDGGRIRFRDDGRAVDDVARRDVLAPVHARVAPGAVRVHPHRLERGRRRVARRRVQRLLGRRVRAAQRLDRHGFHDELLARHEEREAAAVRGFELRLQRRAVAVHDDDRRIRAFVAQVHAAQHVDARRRHALRQQVRARGRGQRVEFRREVGRTDIVQAALDGALAHRALVR